MSKGRTFREFVAHQVARCESLPAQHNFFFSEAAQTEICDWLERAAGISPQEAAQSDLEWINTSRPASLVKATIEELLDGGIAAPLPRFREVWNQLTRRPVEPNYDCRDCGGSGYAIREIGAFEGAVRCPNGCLVPADRMVTPQGRRDDAAQAEFVKAFGEDLAEIAKAKTKA